MLLDFRDLAYRSAPHPIQLVTSSALRLGLRPVPIFSLRTPANTPYENGLQHALNSSGYGMGLRITPEELNCSRFGEMLDSRLRRYGASASDVHLLVDRGEVGSGSVRYDDFERLIPYVDNWRTLTVLAGSFPEDLIGIPPGSIHRRRRHEWLQWQELKTLRGRRPAYGDYATQHVVYKDPVPMPNPSASIRYTTEDEYVILRGEGILNERGPGRAQWNAWAQILIDMPYYFGSGFSAGDRYIAERAADGKNTGSPQTWLQASFSHHVTMTALQVAGQLTHSQREWPQRHQLDLDDSQRPSI